MSLKEEYLKRIQVIQKKQKLRRKKYNFINSEEEKSISETKYKINDLKSKLQHEQEVLYTSKNKLEKISNKEIINKVFPKKIEFSNTDFNKLLVSEEEKSNSENNIIKDSIKLKEKEYDYQFKRVLEEFEEKNIILLTKNKNKEKQIEELNEKIQDLKLKLEKEVDKKKLNIQNRFNNRHNSINIINQYQNQVKLQRNELRKKQKNISNKEKELNILISNNLLYKENELNNLNQYIKEQKHKLENQEITKKDYFTDFKLKNNLYQKNLNTRRNQEIELKNIIENLKSNLKEKLPVIPYNVNILNNYDSIKFLKQEIKENSFILYQKKLEKTILQNLLNKNKSRYDDLFMNIDSEKSKQLLVLQNQIQDNLNKFYEIKNNINLYKKKQVSDNKLKLLNFLNNNIYLLFDKKRNLILKSELENTIDTISNQIIILKNKIHNNTYILDKMEIKFEVESLKREENDNLLTIDELLEIEELNLKIISC